MSPTPHKSSLHNATPQAQPTLYGIDYRIYQAVTIKSRFACCHVMVTDCGGGNPRATPQATIFCPTSTFTFGLGWFRVPALLMQPLGKASTELMDKTSPLCTHRC